MSLVLAAALVLVALSRSKGSACDAYRSDKNLIINSQTIKAQVASTESAKEVGLGGRACISAGRGMLFTFSRPGYYAFWMRDMRFPIDIVWISSSHHIVTFYSDVKPSTYPRTFVSDKPAEYVLELQAGRSKSLGIVTGTAVSF